VTTKRIKVQRDRPRGSSSSHASVIQKKSAEAAAEARFIPERSTVRVVAIAVIIFVVAHLARWSD
jgi:hypothetical protein